jgi:hypothetical protein
MAPDLEPSESVIYGPVLCGRDEIEELEMLDWCMTNLNGNPIKRREFSDTIKLDAGETGAGATLVGGELSFSQALAVALIGTSSTRREMAGFEMFLRERGAEVCHHRVRFMFDSAAAVCILVRGGSPVPCLTSLTKRIFRLLLKHSITPVYEWTRRENNVEADRLSKRWDQSWVLTNAVAARVRARYPGVPIVLRRFNTYFTILVRLHGRHVLIAPFWPAQRWWPLLMRARKNLIWLGPAEGIFKPLWEGDPIGVGRPRWEMCACLI